VSCWEILDLSPNASKKEIKRRYSQLVKQYHPEEYPEKFSEIRSAYEVALASIQTHKPPPSDVSSYQQHGYQVEAVNYQSKHSEDIARKSQQDDEKKEVENFIEHEKTKLSHLCDLIDSLIENKNRNKWSSWQIVLEKNDLLHHGAKTYFEKYIFDALMKLAITEQISSHIFRKINEYFGWLQDYTRLLAMADNDDADYFAYLVKHAAAEEPLQPADPSEHYNDKQQRQHYVEMILADPSEDPNVKEFFEKERNQLLALCAQLDRIIKHNPNDWSLWQAVLVDHGLQTQTAQQYFEYYIFHLLIKLSMEKKLSPIVVKQVETTFYWLNDPERLRSMGSKSTIEYYQTIIDCAYFKEKGIAPTSANVKKKPKPKQAKEDDGFWLIKMMVMAGILRALANLFYSVDFEQVVQNTIKGVQSSYHNFFHDEKYLELKVISQEGLLDNETYLGYIAKSVQNAKLGSPTI
jgi:hypothetical protein